MKLTRTNSHSSPFSRCERWGQERCCEAPTSQSSVSPTGSHAHPLSPWASVFLFFDHTLLASLATDITQQVCHCRCGLSSVKGFPVEGVCGFFTYHLDVYIHSVFALAGQHSCLSARGPCCVFSSGTSVNTYKDNFPSPINVEPLFLLTFFFLMYRKMQPCCTKHLWLFLMTLGNRFRSHLIRVWHFSFMLSYLKL